jgi:hypothetical protein
MRLRNEVIRDIGGVIRAVERLGPLSAYHQGDRHAVWRPRVQEERVQSLVGFVKEALCAHTRISRADRRTQVSFWRWNLGLSSQTELEGVVVRGSQ